MASSNSFQLLARSGYTARGTVYTLVAGLALYSVIAGGAAQPDSKSALTVVLTQPFGRIWLGLIAAGLLAFVAWRIAQCFANVDAHPSDLKGYAIRTGFLVSAATYLSLAVFALSQALNVSGGGGSSGEEKVTSWLIAQAFGPYLVAALGAVVVGIGIAQILKGVRQRYRDYLRIPSTSGIVIDCICIFGLAARGVIFIIIGIFFLYAAFAIDPDQAGGIADAFVWIRGLPFGSALYALAGLGLLAFGIYNFVVARYRRIKSPSFVSAVLA